MKKTLLLLIILLANLQNVIGQNNIKFSIIETTDMPNSEKEHFYSLEIENSTNKTQTFTFSVNPKTCLIDDHKEHTDLEFEFYNETKTSKINDKIVNSNDNEKFYLKTIRPNNAKLSAWNCSKIYITNTLTNEKTFVSLMSFMQDPKNVH